MSDVFISHVKENADIALEIAQRLEQAGYTTWYYERDMLPGPSHLEQTNQAIEESQAVILLISKSSVTSGEVDSEVDWAHLTHKPFVPILIDMDWEDFEKRQRKWRRIMGSVVGINLPPEGTAALVPRVLDGLKALGVCSRQEQARIMTDLLAKAEQAQSVRNWDQAIALLEKARELAPDDQIVEERLAAARMGQRAQRLEAILDRANQATDAEKWDEAVGVLKEYLSLVPEDSVVQDRLREVQQQQRESQLNALRSRARSLAEAEEWDEALSTWREVLALSPEDREATEAGIQQIEKLREMAQTYAQAHAAVVKEEYDRAIKLLKKVVLEDENYKQASHLLAKAVDLRRTGGPPQPSRWLWGAVATVALVAVVLILTQVVPRLAPSGQETAVLSTEAVVGATAVDLDEDVTPILPGTEGGTATSQVELAPNVTATSSLAQSKPETATPTRSVEPTTRPPTPTIALASTATPAQAATPVPSPVGTVPPPPTPLPRAEDAISPENAEQVVQLARWGKGTVNEIAYSPDGALLAVASSLGIYFYDSETMSEVRFIETEQAVQSLSFAPDGTLLAAAFTDGTVQLWTVADGMPLPTLQAQDIRSPVAFSPDGKTLVSLSEDGAVQVWGVADGALLSTLAGDWSSVGRIAPSPDGSILALTSGQTVRLFRVADGKLLAAMQGHTSTVTGIVFSPDGKTLVSGSSDHTLRLWRTDDGAPLLTLDGHTDTVLDVVFAPDGKTVASGSADNTVRLWRAVDGALLRTLEGHTGTVRSISFSPDGATLASGSGEDSTLRLWRVADGELLRTLQVHASSAVRTVAFAPDGKTLASGSADTMVRLWRVTDGELLYTFDGHTGTVLSVSFSPSGSTLASASSDGTARLWQVADGTSLHILEGHTSSVNSVAFSPGGKTLASGSADGTVQLWGVPNGELLHTITECPGWVRSVAFSPDGRMLVSGSDGDVRLWSTLDWLLLRTLKLSFTFRYGVNAVTFSRDGEMLAAAGREDWLSASYPRDAEIGLGNPADVQFSAYVGRGRHWVNSLTFSPNGRVLASASSDSTVRLWDTTEATLLRTLEGHTYAVNGVAVSPDGGTLASGSSDGTIRLWGVAR